MHSTQDGSFDSLDYLMRPIFEKGFLPQMQTHVLHSHRKTFPADVRIQQSTLHSLYVAHLYLEAFH